MDSALRSDDVVIGQLRMRGPAIEQQRLQQTLTSLSWPHTQGEEWIFIRRLNVKASVQQLPRELVELTRDKLSKAKPPGVQSDVIRFNNLAELLAYLLADLAHGRAAQCWYWQRWSGLFSLTPSAALRHMFSEYLVDLPVISGQLQQLKMLDDVWFGLTEADAEQLLNELGWKLGVRLPDVVPDITSDDESSIQPLSSNLLHPLLVRWHSLLKQVETGSPHYLLALLIIAQEAAPLVLQNAPSALIQYLHKRLHNLLIPEVQADSQQLIVPIRHNTDAEKDSNVSALRVEKQLRVEYENLLARSSSEADTVMQEQQNVPLTRTVFDEKSGDSVEKASDQQSPVPDEAEILQSTANRERDVVNNRADLIQGLNSKHDENVTDEDHADQHLISLPEAAQPIIHTQQGGLFYCLNFLNRPECQAIMAEHWRLLPDGWGWLYRLGQTLQLDQDDAVIDFICMQLGLDNRQALDQLAALPAASELNRLAQHWYAKTEVWNSTLLQLDATIKYSASHVDIHTAINNVQLPVRLAGLDINPGWLPWLGKVVSFHYDN